VRVSECEHRLDETPREHDREHGDEGQHDPTRRGLRLTRLEQIEPDADKARDAGAQQQQGRPAPGLVSSFVARASVSSAVNGRRSPDGTDVGGRGRVEAGERRELPRRDHWRPRTATAEPSAITMRNRVIAGASTMAAASVASPFNRLRAWVYESSLVCACRRTLSSISSECTSHHR